MNKLFPIILLLANICLAQQNLSIDYTPLKSSGVLPDIFTQNIRNVIKNDISALNKQNENDKTLKANYLTEANYEIEKIVKSGNTLINDEVTIYLNKVADVILKNNPELRNELHIYTLKSSVVNAYSYDKGYIFIDIGLIAQAETEAQLAYILCHEISHYTKKHHINSYVQNKKIDKQDYSGKSNDDRLIEKCQYSKESESEADIEGFRLFEQTKYNLKQAEKAFDVLQYAHLPFELLEFKKAFFETEKFKLPEGYFLKEVTSIRNNSNEDDTKHTHPNTAKRKLAIAELIVRRDNAGRVNSILSAEDFEYIRDLSRMELCRLYLKNRDYPNALYAAYIIANKYPNNQYITEVISKCMYAITLYGQGKLKYNKDSYLENGIPTHRDIESYPQQLYYFINKMPSNEWAMMSLNYVYRNHKKFPENKKIGGYADSLFKIMATINWKISDFVRTTIMPGTEKNEKIDSQAPPETKSKTDIIASIQKQNSFKNSDTAYYKEMFVDLFMSDAEFTSKFPLVGSKDNSYSGGGFTDYEKPKTNSNKTKSKKGDVVSSKSKIENVLLLEPFYVKIDDSKEEGFQYLASDERQERYTEIVNNCAKIQDFGLVTLDPGLISIGDVEKMNDYSVINDWFAEKFDADDNNAILNTNDIDQLILKYGTKYVLKTGIVNYKPKHGRKRNYYYAFIYDIKSNAIVFKKYEVFKGKDSKDMINAKVYQTFFDLKHSK